MKNKGNARKGKSKSGRNKNSARPPSDRAQASGGDKVLVYRGVGFPDEYYCDLVYSSTVTTNAIIPPSYQTFQSSLYDPDLSGTGSQPTFYDQLNAIYARYQVMGMRADVAVATYGGPSYVPLNIATIWTDELPGSIGVDDAAMYRFSTTRMQGGTGAPVCTFVETMDMKRIHGYKDIKQVASLSALINANPADMAFFTIITGPVDGTTGVTRAIRTKITFRCRFFSLVTPNPS